MKLDNPTSRDIAEIAGVSQATVSRALRNSPLVREETRERIQRIARELNYFVNRNAAGLRSQQSNTIALLLFDETEGTEVQINPFFLSMFGYITRSAAALGYDVLVSLQQLSDDWHIEYQASNRADGLILLGYGDYIKYREKLTALANANTRFVIWGATINEQPGHSVGCDNVDGGYQATKHLLQQGRRKIAFLGSTSRRSPELAAGRGSLRGRAPGPGGAGAASSSGTAATALGGRDAHRWPRTGPPTRRGWPAGPRCRRCARPPSRPPSAGGGCSWPIHQR